MTPAEIDAAARELVERTTQAQGIPYHVSDPATLRRLAALMTTHRTAGAEVQSPAPASEGTRDARRAAA